MVRLANKGLRCSDADSPTQPVGVVESLDDWRRRAEGRGIPQWMQMGAAAIGKAVGLAIVEMRASGQAIAEAVE